MKGGRRNGKNFVCGRVYFERFEVGEVSRSPVKGLSWLIVCLLVTAGIIGLWYFIPEGTGLSEPATVPGRQSSFRFVRSDDLVEDGDSLRRDVLMTAIKRVSQDGLTGEMILDADGTTNTRTPFVIYSHPDLDVTDRVREVYLEILKQESSGSQGHQSE